MNYDYKIVEEKMLQLPEEMQLALNSTEIIDSVKKIGDRYQLKLDQQEILFNQVAYIMLGLLPSAEFVGTFSKDTEITEEISKNIARDINKEVFDKIKSYMKVAQEQKTAENMGDEINELQTQQIDKNIAQNQVSTVEKAGGFEVIKERIINETAEQGNVEKKGEIMKGIENPSNIKTEPMVDRLLSRPASSKLEEVTVKGVSNGSLVDSDIYREKI